MQLYVNAPDRRVLLDQAALTALPSLQAAGATTLDWRSPLQHPLFTTDQRVCVGDGARSLRTRRR